MHAHISVIIIDQLMVFVHRSAQNVYFSLKQRQLADRSETVFRLHPFVILVTVRRTDNVMPVLIFTDRVQVQIPDVCFAAEGAERLMHSFPVLLVFVQQLQILPGVDRHQDGIRYCSCDLIRLLDRPVQHIAVRVMKDTRKCYEARKQKKNRNLHKD